MPTTREKWNMTNPPSFVMYVVLVKPTPKSVFDPCWGEFGIAHGTYTKGFARKRDANNECRILRTHYGVKNAYVQQYGPYK
jgi:hypothetical protein